MKLEEIDWPLRACVEDLRRAYGNETSAHAFSSLYIWKADMNLSLLCRSGFFAVRFGLRGANSWFFPCGAAPEVRAFIEERMGPEEPPCRLYYAREAEAALLETWFPGKFDIRRSPEDDEYIYDRREQLELNGKAFRRQRHDLHRAQERHALQISAIGPENLEQCRQVLNEWKSRPHDHSGSGLMDAAAGDTMLRSFRELDGFGILVKEGDRPAAVAAGYPLTESVFDLCVCQQITPDPEVSTFARHALLRELGEELREVNGEEDLGLEGLRELKEGLRPSRKIEMYACTQRTERKSEPVRGPL